MKKKTRKLVLCFLHLLKAGKWLLLSWESVFSLIPLGAG